MPYTTVYLQYAESRNEESDFSDINEEEEEELDVDEYQNFDDKIFVEFVPIKLCAKEPKGEFIELELDFSAKVGDVLHIVVVRYNNYRARLLEEWCIETVMENGDEAEELVEELDGGFSNSECAEDKNHESLIIKAEVFSMTLHK
jgi:phosphodiesterase/alkaline phosphatase D-like protein